jgi:NAD(P)-dependent dehydrogenase (short-subunit alcohol dehydrogenase family)
MEDGDAAARGLRAIVRGFVESGASMFLIDRDDFVKQVVEDLRGEGFDVHVALADVTDEAQMVRPLAEIGEVWGNLYTLVNNARIITIKDLEPPASGIFSASCNFGGGPSPNLRAGLPTAADTTENPAHRAAARHRRGDRHPRQQAWAAAIDRSRTLPTTAHDLDISA